MKLLKMPELSPRLLTVAKKVRGCKVADIGTDHGLLPVFLVKNGHCLFAYASDIREGPLSHARAYIHQNGMDDRIQTFLSDGLIDIPDDFDVCVIAGMGGETIAGIIDAKKPDVRYVLQPMTSAEDLREYLYTNGFTITDEDIVCEGEKIYTVICACKGFCSYSHMDTVVSPPVRNGRSEFRNRYLYHLVNKREKILSGLEMASVKDMEQIERIKFEISEIKSYASM